MAIINGTEGPDKLTGTAVDDTIHGLGGNDVINGLGGNDILFGGDGADTISGGTGINTYIGGAGADTFDLTQESGFIGRSIVDYSSSPSGVTISNFTSDPGHGGDAEGDHFIGVAYVLIGSAFADTLTGGGGATLEGGAGADHLVALGSNNTASYEHSSAAVTVSLTTGLAHGGDAEGDVFIGIANLIGSAFNDTLAGSPGDNVLTGGAGADSLFGSVGEDRALYSASAAGVTVDLTTGTGTGGDAQGDHLNSIEDLTGSNFADTLIGSDAGNSLDGGTGSDGIYGRAGDDSLTGGSGDDRLVGEAGADQLNGGAGSDWAYYHTAGAAVSVDLGLGVGTAGDAQDDTFTSIENLYGSLYNDSLSGDAGANQLLGNTGGDTLTGGLEADVFIYRALSDSTDTTTIRQDTITDFSHAQGDKIDLRPIDADGKAANGDTAFTFTPGGVFSGSGHEVIVKAAGAGGYTVLVDVDGDKNDDMAITVHSATALVAADFLL